MTEPAGTTSTRPPFSANGSANGSAPAPPRTSASGRMRTKISSMRIGLIAGAVVLTVMLIFIVQNANAVSINFLGAHLRLSLAVALLFAAIAGSLVTAVAGTARITQLRRIMRRDRRQPHSGKAPATSR
jgi:putative membrane protein